MSDDYITTQAARDRFAATGLTYDDVTEGDVEVLYMMLNREVRRAVKEGEMSIDTIHMSKKVTVKKKSNGAITAAFLFINSHYFTQRECVSFNCDGFIGFCGWADKKNTQPIVRAFIEWCGYMQRGTKAPIAWVSEQSWEGDWDEHPSCSVCGSYNVGKFCADCGVELYEEEES